MNKNMVVAAAVGIVAIVVAIPAGYFVYNKHEEKELMDCVYNSAALRGQDAAKAESLAREAAHKMQANGIMSSIDSYTMAATIYGCTYR